MKVGFSGTRSGMTSEQHQTLIIQLHKAGATELHHGLCRGADEQAHDIGRALGLRIIGHPPSSSGLRSDRECDELRTPRPFLVRNRNLVLETELLLATPAGLERLRSGTWSTVRFSRKISSPYLVIKPDGSIQ